MQKSRAFVLLLASCWFSLYAVSLGAQEWDDWDFYATDLYARGDQTFTITVGTIMPTVFIGFNESGDRTGTIPHNFSPAVGGTISLAYTYFLGANLFLGGELGVSFNYTLRRNTLFVVPFGLRAGWQFVFGTFEVPLLVTFGMARHSYMDAVYWGAFLRGGVSVFYRFSPEWSFGLNADWNWYPQRPRRDGQRIPAENVDAHILGISISARYHF
ncbi:MAG: hypothetical protein FWD88_02915 [Treponema sp.]|nr:hypothetical protein [Treponema sp.]